MAVSTIIAVVYLAIFIPILIIHETVPSAPTNPTLYRGLNLTEAWLDLAELTNGYHPFNSRRNDEVRNWLLLRIEAILDSNGANFQSEGLSDDVKEYNLDTPATLPTLQERAAPAATIFNDFVSNYTSTALLSIGSNGRSPAYSTYFEGSNIIVYVRGTEDEEGEWWNSPSSYKSLKMHGKGGVMVNAHFDSVSTGYGATDDGMGVVTTLQLIKYFTTSGNTPKKGLVALFNNGEEDGLFGAKAFVSHPMASFVHTFLNLEGAGAGGRATLFRSTDTEVTRAYGKSPHPFGTVVSGDGFAAGFVRSETDYIVFRGEGWRGLDVAFWNPRARYHTNQDDAKHASKDSLWHMLSASVETTKYLTSRVNDFVGPRGDDDPSKVSNGKGSDGVWFDLFGQAFAVFGLRTLFAWSLALLISSPLILLLLTFILIRSDKYYLFTGAVKPDGHENEEISLQGWRGTFRFPIATIIAGSLTIGSAFLLRKYNPLIVYSSQYSVWTMSLCLFFSVFWFIMAGSNFVRPSALHRTYSLLWMYVFGWLVLVGATVLEDRFKIGSGYLFVFYESAVFLAALVGLLELFALPTITSVIETAHDEHETREGLEEVPHVFEDDDPSETTPLVGNYPRNAGVVGRHPRTTIGAKFARIYRRTSFTEMADGAHDGHEPKNHAYGEEQVWSEKLPSWTWFIQFLLIGPFILVIVGQVGLFLVGATAQTGTDGSPLLFPYLVVAFFSILILLPIGPFIHRITHQLPTLLFILFIGTLIYNLIAFPFSAENRYKAYFQQTVDLDTGINLVTISGLEEYVRDIITYIPSASGQHIPCEVRPEVRSGLTYCSYTGIAPNVISNVSEGVPPEKGYANWLNYNVTRVKGQNKATFHVLGAETKACSIRFSEPFSGFTIKGAAPNNGKWKDVPESGSDLIKLWHRDWNREWEVEVEWPVSKGKQPGDEGRNGRVACGWADQNTLGTIPALDEFKRFAPQWSGVSKAAEGLVEGSKAFVV